MDYLSELEKELANFTHKLYTGIGSIQEQVIHLDPQTRARMVNTLGAELASAHLNVINVINKLPQELFVQNRDKQESEILSLQKEYEIAVARLEKLQGKARELHSSIEKSFEEMGS